MSNGINMAAADTVTVKSGNTLSGLAQKYGVTVGDIQKANNMGESTKIKVGQTIVIPTQGKPQDEEYLSMLKQAMGDKYDEYKINKDYDSYEVEISHKRGAFFCDIKEDFELEAGDLIHYNPNLKTDPRIPNNDPNKSIGERILQVFDKSLFSATGYKGKYDSYLLPPEYVITLPADKIRVSKK